MRMADSASSTVKCFLLMLLIIRAKASPLNSSASFEEFGSPEDKAWPELSLNWRVVAGSIIGFVGAALGSVGGVGGGGIFVPDLNLIFQFDIKSSSALSQCMIMGAAAFNVVYNLRLKHPTKNNLPMIDYEIALLIQPMILVGTTVGVALSIVLAAWMIKILLTAFFLVISVRSFLKGLQAWNRETVLQISERRQRSAAAEFEGSPYRSLVSKSASETGLEGSISFNMHWEKLGMLFVILCIFLALLMLQGRTARCGFWFWMFNALQIPAGLLATGYQMLKIKRAATEEETIWVERVEWTTFKLVYCAAAGIVAGMAGGLFGMGAGFIIGPVIMSIGLVPQVTRATATTLMFFSSVVAVVGYHILHRFPIPYASFLVVISIVAAICSRYIVRKMVMLFRRTSMIIFLLAALIFASALVLGWREVVLLVLGKRRSLNFLALCGQKVTLF